MARPVRYNAKDFPPSNLDWGKLITPFGLATDAIARYDSFLGILPDRNILISPLMTQEATSSSRIEGARATAGDVLVFEAGEKGIDPSIRGDIQEVINYRKALAQAERMLADLPLCGRVLKSSHSVLLEGVRGQNKSPGRYRMDQNWIGKPGSSVENATYVPAPPKEVEAEMARWEAYVNSVDTPPLIKIAVAHAQFEAIHPFDDGNGRIGRMVIPLMLNLEGILREPCFYLSEFFEHRNEEYQERLLAVSAEHDWTGWCEFFLEAVARQAEDNNVKAQKIYMLYQGMLTFLADNVKSNAADIATCLFSSIAFPASLLAQRKLLSESTSRRTMKLLADNGLVKEIIPHKGRNAAIVAIPELFEIATGTKL